MRIALVLAASPGYSETFFRSKIKGLQASGMEVLLFCGINNEDFDLCSAIELPKKEQGFVTQFIQIIWVYVGLFGSIRSVLRFIGLEQKNRVSWIKILKRLYLYAPILRSDFDWLHFGFGTLALGAENLANAKMAKMAVSFRGFDIGVYPLKHPGCYEKLWNKVDKIHVISNDIADLLYKHGFNGQARVVKITPAIDTLFFSSNNLSKLKEPLQLVSVARLHWKKGLDYTLEALWQLKRVGVPFNYRIIGSGPEEEALKFATYQFGLQDEVVFLGTLKSNQIKEELERSDIYLQYSVQEGFCNAVLEAQSMGLLCIVSDAEGLAENVLDGTTGWVVPKRQPTLLAQKIETVISLGKEEQQEFRNKAIKRVRKKFNIEKQQQEFIEFYRN